MRRTILISSAARKHSGRLCRLIAAGAFVSVAWGQQQTYSRPPSAISPTSMAECDRLAGSYSRLQQRITADHQACLDSNSKSRSQGAKGPEPPGRCSVPVCQRLHDLMHDPFYAGAADVSACRQQVQAKLDQDRKRKEEEETRRRHIEEDRKAAADLRKRKEYGDKQDREQYTRDAAAKQAAIDNEKWHEKHDAWERQKTQQADLAHEKRTLDRQQSDQKLGLDNVAQRHDAWATREKSRRDRERSIMDAYDKQLDSLDEQQRNALAEKIAKQLEQIHDERKQDRDPGK
jgi:hypothetical protein